MKLALLGATGSIGRSALSVIRANPGCFDPVLFSACSGRDALAPLAKEFPEARLVLAASEDLIQAIKESGAERALNGIAGAAGLAPSLAVLETGADLCLANKETVVMAYNLVKKTAETHGARIIPVDSEHSGLFALVNAHGAENIAELIITCSGGAFRERSARELAQVSAKDALKHPTWQMGAKITIDSATLANKGLEVIEAARLFNLPPEKIKVVIHPQSIVHALVRLNDGAVYAQLSQPDMRLPIHSALFYPEIKPCQFAALDI
jgi:1-deoxy-D-xylulose-5-phosphate reductoisomerase